MIKPGKKYITRFVLYLSTAIAGGAGWKTGMNELRSHREHLQNYRPEVGAPAGDPWPNTPMDGSGLIMIFILLSFIIFMFGLYKLIELAKSK